MLTNSHGLEKASIQSFIVKGQSMLPVLSEGDTCLVAVGDRPKLEVGDIFCFEFFGMQVVHRIIGKGQLCGEAIFLERGDNFPVASLVFEEAVFGKVVAKIIDDKGGYSGYKISGKEKIVLEVWAGYVRAISRLLLDRLVRSRKFRRRLFVQKVLFALTVIFPTGLFCGDQPLRKRFSCLTVMWRNIFYNRAGEFVRVARETPGKISVIFPSNQWLPDDDLVTSLGAKRGKSRKDAQKGVMLNEEETMDKADH